MSVFNIIDLSKLAFDKLKFAAIQDWINGTVSYQTPVILTDGANVDWDQTKNYNAQVTLAGSRALRFPALKPGSYGTIKIIQGGSGSYTLTLPSAYTNKVANAGAGALTLSTAVAAADIASFYYDGTNLNWTLSTDFT
jgi:hypothetical protein